MRTEPRIDRIVGRRLQVRAEDDLAPAADAVAERAQSVGRCRAVPREAARLAAGSRFAALVQRAFKVPSLRLRAFVIFCAAGSDDERVAPGA
jgi:hypothetical protein